jgi:hypothetical protein
MKATLLGGLLLTVTVLTPAVAQPSRDRTLEFGGLRFRASPQAAYAYEIVPGGGALIRSVTGDGKGAFLNRWVPAGEYLGKRVRISTRLKLEAADEAACGMGAWREGAPLNTAGAPALSGSTDWNDCKVVMDIPAMADRLELRFYLRGNGTVRSEGFQIETVGRDVPVTPAWPSRAEPFNLAFDR